MREVVLPKTEMDPEYDLARFIRLSHPSRRARARSKPEPTLRFIVNNRRTGTRKAFNYSSGPSNGPDTSGRHGDYQWRCTTQSPTAAVYNYELNWEDIKEIDWRIWGGENPIENDDIILHLRVIG